MKPAWILLAAVAVCSLGRPCRANGPDFARAVRPILSNRCFKCHGPDADHQEPEPKQRKRFPAPLAEAGH